MTKDNKVTSCWWKEVLNYYVEPPISDLFVEESQFDGKDFKMIEQIDKYFNPSGAIDSLGNIFNLIDIKQASDKSVITLKAQFSHFFASLKLGGIAINPALQVGFMLQALVSQYHGVVQIFASAATPCHHPPSNPLSTNARHTTKTPGKDRSARTVNQHGPLQPTQQALQATSPIHTMPSPNAHSTIICLDGAMDARMAVRNVWCATIHQTSPPITARTAQTSRKLGLNLSNGHQLMAGTQHLRSAKKPPL